MKVTCSISNGLTNSQSVSVLWKDNIQIVHFVSGVPAIFWVHKVMPKKLIATQMRVLFWNMDSVVGLQICNSYQLYRKSILELFTLCWVHQQFSGVRKAMSKLLFWKKAKGPNNQDKRNYVHRILRSTKRGIAIDTIIHVSAF